MISELATISVEFLTDVTYMEYVKRLISTSSGQRSAMQTTFTVNVRISAAGNEHSVQFLHQISTIGIKYKLYEKIIYPSSQKLCVMAMWPQIMPRSEL